MSAAPSAEPPDVHVGILMATYNGAATLEEQLASLADQSHQDWHLLASDDGSQDDSAALLQRFARHRNVTCLQGPGRGAAQNFLSLLRAAPAYLPEGSWLAFCDQDDVWLPDRLARGIRTLQDGDAARPALYCSRTWIVDNSLNGRRLSPPRPRPVGFCNALVQNIAAGNTILLNPVAARLLCDAATEVEAIVMHDWWAYQLISGAGGRIAHDDSPTLLYRQHAANEVGANHGAQAQWQRMTRLLGGEYRAWNETNLEALNASSHRLSPESREKLLLFKTLRGQSLLKRLNALGKLGAYRQTLIGTMALWVAAALHRL